MAKLKAILTKDEHDKLDAALKDLYVDGGNGTFRLDSDHEDVTGLKNTLQALRVEQDAQRLLLKKYEGIDPEKAKEAQQKLDDLAREEAEKKGQYDTLVSQLKQNHQKELKIKEDEVGALKTDIDKLVVDREIVTTLSSDKVKGSVKALMPHMRQYVKSERQADGTYKTIVHDGKGTPRIRDGQGAPMTLEDLALEMRSDKEFAPLFAAQSSGGSGSAPGAAGSGGAGSGVRTISAKDSAAMSANLADIAAGKVVVTD